MMKATQCLITTSTEFGGCVSFQLLLCLEANSLPFPAHLRPWIKHSSKHIKTKMGRFFTRWFLYLSFALKQYLLPWVQCLLPHRSNPISQVRMAAWEPLNVHTLVTCRIQENVLANVNSHCRIKNLIQHKLFHAFNALFNTYLSWDKEQSDLSAFKKLY